MADEVAVTDERIQAIFEQAPIGEAVLSLDGKLLAVNSALCAMLGCSRSELLASGIEALTHAEDRATAFDLVQAVSRGDRPSFTTEKRYIHKSGETVHARVHVALIRDLEGRPERILELIEDITERRAVEDQLRRSNELLAEAQQLAHLGNWEVDLRGRSIWFSDEMFRLFGYEPGEMKLDFDMRSRLFHPDDLQRVPASWEEEEQSRTEPVAYDVRVLHPSGEMRWLHVRSKPELDEVGTPIRVYGTAQDITERKKADDEIRRARRDAEEANRAKSEFLSRMSHELRTPLNSVLGFAEVLESEELTEDQRESVSYILKGGLHLLQLINDVLDIARIETGSLSFSMEPVSVYEALSDASDLVRAQARHRGIEVHDCPSESCGHLVVADRQRLTQVFINLLSNAIKYNRAEGKVRLGCHPEADGRLRVTVSDTGRGMSDEELSRLFTPFERLGAENTGVDGTGLGLALAKTAVEAMGGTIGATSQRGIGSTFWVELPLAEDRAPEAETGVDSSAEASHLTNNLRVLYVEDNLPNAQLMRRILRRRPALELLVARTGREAVDVIARELPDIVLLDVHLPDFSGLELLSRVRELPGGERRPVIVVSADATPEQVERFLRAGARHYVTKPVRTQAFLVALDETVRWMEGAAAEDATGEGGTET